MKAHEARLRPLVPSCWMSAVPTAHDAYLKVLEQGCRVLGLQVNAPGDVSSLLHEG